MGELVVLPTARAWRARVTAASRGEVDALMGRSRGTELRLQDIANSFTQFAVDLEAIERRCHTLARISELCCLAAGTGNVQLMRLAREIARLRYAALAKDEMARIGARAAHAGDAPRPADRSGAVLSDPGSSPVCGD